VRDIQRRSGYERHANKVCFQELEIHPNEESSRAFAFEWHGQDEVTHRSDPDVQRRHLSCEGSQSRDRGRSENGNALGTSNMALSQDPHENRQNSDEWNRKYKVDGEKEQICIPYSSRCAELQEVRSSAAQASAANAAFDGA